MLARSHFSVTIILLHMTMMIAFFGLRAANAMPYPTQLLKTSSKTKFVLIGHVSGKDGIEIGRILAKSRILAIVEGTTAFSICVIPEQRRQATSLVVKYAKKHGIKFFRAPPQVVYYDLSGKKPASK